MKMICLLWELNRKLSIHRGILLLACQPMKGRVSVEVMGMGKINTLNWRKNLIFKSSSHSLSLVDKTTMKEISMIYDEN